MCLLPKKAKMATLRMIQFGNGRCWETARQRIRAAEWDKYRSDVGTSVSPRTHLSPIWMLRKAWWLSCLHFVHGPQFGSKCPRAKVKPVRRFHADGQHLRGIWVFRDRSFIHWLPSIPIAERLLTAHS